MPHLEPAQPGSLFELEHAGIKRWAEKSTGVGWDCSVQIPPLLKLVALLKLMQNRLQFQESSKAHAAVNRSGYNSWLR